MSAGRDFDQLGESIANLSNRESAQEGEVKERVHGCMIGSQPILVSAIVDSYFDRDRCVNKTNYSRWNANEVRVATVGSTGKAVELLIQLSAVRKLVAYPATSVTKPPPTTKTGSFL